MSKLGDCLKELRGELSLTDVERGTGLSRRLVLSYERAEKVPGPENLIRLSEYYEVDYVDIRARYYQDAFANEQEREAAMRALMWMGLI